MKTLTLATYNIRHGAGMDNILNLERQIDVISKINPDVIALQEVDRFTTRTRKFDEPAIFADGIKSLPNWHFSKSIDFSGGDYGNTILSKEKPLSTSVVNMPEPNEPRSIAICEFNDFIFCGTHLSLLEEYRFKALENFRAIAASTNKPVFFAGDWNAYPDSRFIQELKKDFTLLTPLDKPTFHGSNARVIDYIAVDSAHAKSVNVISAEVIPDTISSDHKPVVVKIELL